MAARGPRGRESSSPTPTWQVLLTSRLLLLLEVLASQWACSTAGDDDDEGGENDDEEGDDEEDEDEDGDDCDDDGGDDEDNDDGGDDEDNDSDNDDGGDGDGDDDDDDDDDDELMTMMMTVTMFTMIMVMMMRMMVMAMMMRMMVMALMALPDDRVYGNARVVQECSSAWRTKAPTDSTKARWQRRSSRCCCEETLILGTSCQCFLDGKPQHSASSIFYGLGCLQRLMMLLIGSHRTSSLMMMRCVGLQRGRRGADGGGPRKPRVVLRGADPHDLRVMTGASLGSAHVRVWKP